jgi:hypothetical protein
MARVEAFFADETPNNLGVVDLVLTKVDPARR